MLLEKTKELFNAFTPEAHDFVRKEINGKNKKSLSNLQKAKDRNLVVIKSFTDHKLDLLTFDWQTIEMDRNWWWQMQALPFLNWFAQSVNIFKGSEKAEYLNYTIGAFMNWLSLEETGQHQPLRWHDHAAAFRLTHITNWLMAIASDEALKTEFLKSELAKSVADIVANHIHWLTLNENYSKHTNHGFDQALAVYSLGLYVGNTLWDSQIGLAKQRLINEIRFAFTEEGVHKENSPGYHLFMMRRLDKLVDLKLIGDTEVAPEAERFRDGAARFLEAVTLPDGLLPMIGDTRWGLKGKSKTDIKDDLVFDFSKSGYVIYKGVVNNKEYYILIKNAHFSNYHRHDDDLMLYIYYDGRTILGDGGLGNHNESSYKRIFLRSNLAHSVPIPISGDRPLVANRKEKRKPSIEIVGEVIRCETYAYGEKLIRDISICKEENKIEITVKDVIHNTNCELRENFFIPFLEKVLVSGNKIRVGSDFSIETISSSTIQTAQGFYSEIYNEISTANYIYYSTSDNNKSEFRVIMGVLDD